MGMYLSLPFDKNKAQQLTMVGAKEIDQPESVKEVGVVQDGGDTLICVVENEAFDSAGVIYDDDELRRAAPTDGDDRPRTWIKVDTQFARKFSNDYDKWLMENGLASRNDHPLVKAMQDVIEDAACHAGLSVNEVISYGLGTSSTPELEEVYGAEVREAWEIGRHSSQHLRERVESEAGIDGPGIRESLGMADELGVATAAFTHGILFARAFDRWSAESPEEIPEMRQPNVSDLGKLVINQLSSYLTRGGAERLDLGSAIAEVLDADPKDDVFREAIVRQMEAAKVLSTSIGSASEATEDQQSRLHTGVGFLMGLIVRRAWDELHLSGDGRA